VRYMRLWLCIFSISDAFYFVTVVIDVELYYDTQKDPVLLHKVGYIYYIWCIYLSYLYLSIYLHIYLSIYISIYLSIYHIFIYLPIISSSIYLPIYLSIITIYLSTYLSIYLLYLSIHLSIISIYHIYLSIHLSFISTNHIYIITILSQTCLSVINAVTKKYGSGYSLSPDYKLPRVKSKFIGSTTLQNKQFVNPNTKKRYDGWMNEWIDEWMNEWMDRWFGEWMDGSIDR